MKIPVQPPPSFASLVPTDLTGQNSGNPTSSGLDLDNLGADQADAIPDEGQATVRFKVHHRHSDRRTDQDGNHREKHHVRMHISHFEPHGKKEGDADMDGDKPKKKSKLMESRDAQKAVKQYLA